jgi:predicted CXXCH cytochrome family protein
MDGGVYPNFTTSTLNITNVTGLSGYRYRAVFTNINGTATSNNALLTVITVPSAAGAITGTSTVCQNQGGVIYSVPAISGATSYLWSYSGTGFTSSGTTASITGTFSNTATSGNLTVRGVNACGNGIQSVAFPIVVNNLPSAAGSITGSNTVCQNQNGVAYSTTPISGATGYTWSYTGTGFASSGNTASITASFSNTATSGNLRVAGTNGCGTGTISANYPVTVNPLPSAAGTITGTAADCQGTSGVVYSVTPVLNATSYQWTYSGSGVTIIGSTASITANFIAATAGNFTVRGVNSCGNGIASANYPVTIVTSPGAAGSITGPTAACQNQTGVIYSVTPVSGATAYTWSYTGNGFSASGNTNSITASFSASATAGTLKVTPSNTCGAGTASANFPISINLAPGAAGTITGTSSICNSGAGTYTVPSIVNATSYIWSYSGTGFTPSGNTASITGIFSSAATSGILTVRGSNSCGPGSLSPNFPVTVEYCPPHNLCSGCHINHTSPGAQLTLVGGNANLCMSCHNPAGLANTSPFTDNMKAVPGVGGISHTWNAMAVNTQYQTTLPSNTNMLQRIYSNEIVCSTCHDQHSNAFPPFLRMSNAEDALCLNCHSARDVKRYADNPANKGTHPVGIVYNPVTDPRFKPTTFPLSGTNKVVCSSCHDTHNSTSADGNILRGATVDVTCANCHIDQAARRITTHEGLSCSVCHYTHENGSNNILLVRDNIVTPTLGTKPVVFTANSSATNYGDGIAPFNGVCEVCHTTAVDHYQAASGGTPDARHLPSPQKCVDCHPPWSGIFSANRLLWVSQCHHRQTRRRAGRWQASDCR